MEAVHAVAVEARLQHHNHRHHAVDVVSVKYLLHCSTSIVVSIAALRLAESGEKCNLHIVKPSHQRVMCLRKIEANLTNFWYALSTDI